MSNATPSHIRAISLVLALSVVIGGWMALEYNNRPLVSVEPLPKAMETPTPLEQARPHFSSPADSARQAAQFQRGLDLTFKCQKNGRTSFSDTPCDLDAKVVSVTASEKLPPVRDERLAQMKQQAAQMEADRLAREKAQSAVIASRPTALEPNKAAQCKEVDDWVAHFDARLRQPHDAQFGDYLTGERKKWMDRRFELRC